jgi:hypothetical protein
VAADGTDVARPGLSEPVAPRRHGGELRGRLEGERGPYGLAIFGGKSGEQLLDGHGDL